MAVTSLSICNKALIKVGVEPITSLALDTKAARICNEVYQNLFEEVLQEHPWKFATRRVEIAELDDEPLFGYEHQYQLPTDCLQVLHDPEYDHLEYKIEGRKLLTDETTFQIKYTTNDVEEAEIPPLFSDALAARIGSEIAFALTQNATLKGTLMQEYLRALSKAKSRDSQQSTPEELVSTDWTNARR
jgi:hypothetical protein